MFWSCQIRVSEWICTLQLPECLGTPCSKHARYLKFKWLQRIRNHSQLVRKQIINHLAKLANCLSSLAKWLSVRLQTKWLWVRVPLQSLKVALYLLLLNRKNVLQKFSPQLMNNYSREILSEVFLWLDYRFSGFVIY